MSCYSQDVAIVFIFKCMKASCGLPPQSAPNRPLMNNVFLNWTVLRITTWKSHQYLDDVEVNNGIWAAVDKWWSTAAKWKDQDLLQPWQTVPYQEIWTAGKMHVVWFILGKTRIKHICTVHWNKWGFTLYRENQYNNRLCAQRTLCACLISISLLHCYAEDTACKVTYYDMRDLFFSF